MIEEIHLALDTEIIVIPLQDKPIDVTGPRRVTIPIPQQENGGYQGNLQREIQKA
jgi:hypothetical protein